MLIEKIDKIDEMLKEGKEDDVVQMEVKNFVEDHVDALE
jgi:hypothetical protein